MQLTFCTCDMGTQVLICCLLYPNSSAVMVWFQGGLNVFMCSLDLECFHRKWKKSISFCSLTPLLDSNIRAFAAVGSFKCECAFSPEFFSNGFAWAFALWRAPTSRHNYVIVDSAAITKFENIEVIQCASYTTRYPLAGCFRFCLPHVPALK